LTRPDEASSRNKNGRGHPAHRVLRQQEVHAPIPAIPELYGVARLPYGARHGICTDDASILGGHPAALITVGEAIGHLLSALDGVQGPANAARWLG
jgi:hypothetical protein